MQIVLELTYLGSGADVVVAVYPVERNAGNVLCYCPCKLSQAYCIPCSGSRAKVVDAVSPAGCKALFLTLRQVAMLFATAHETTAMSLDLAWSLDGRRVRDSWSHFLPSTFSLRLRLLLGSSVGVGGAVLLVH